MEAPEPYGSVPADSQADHPAAPSPDNVALVVPFSFGAVVGALMAALLAWAGYQLTEPPPSRPLPLALLEELGIKEQPEPERVPDRPLWPWLAVGAGFGAILGSIVAAAKWMRGQPTDIGTAVGLVIGLFPALLMLVAGLGVKGGGKGVVYAIVGAIFVGPMLGMLLGGIADGLYDRFLFQRRKSPLA